MEPYIYQRGEGPPVLMTHGNPDSSEMWYPLMDRLLGFHFVAPDLPGFGKTAAPADYDYSLESMAQFVHEVITRTKITEPVHLIVHDFGGPFGFAWAVSHPQMVRSICAMNTNFFSDYRWHYWARIWRTPVLGELSMATMNWPLFLRTMKAGSPRLQKSQIRRTYERITPVMKKAVLKLYRATDPKNFSGWEERLLQLTARVPTLVLWGDRDPYISQRYAERFGARKIVHFAESGHWLPLEYPDEVAAEIRKFYE